MDNFFGYLFAFSWVWIPLAGIAAASFKEWLKFKEKTAKLGASTEGLEKSYQALQVENQDLVRRIQNLEAIVTHEVWEAANGVADPQTKAARIDAALLTPEPTDAERAQQLARRLRS
ncbi:MAG: hypothetical protein HKN29_13690 [Rhodothermales bacterium]|nr:hypothetical protein [Rhodothermales bacterium]